MTSDDPKFTAHVLGECEDLTAAERAEIEALIASEPAAASEATETRSLAVRLRAELAGETAAALGDRRRAAVLRAASPAAKVVAFPRWNSALAAIAASLVVGVTGALVFRDLREAPVGNPPMTTRNLSDSPLAMAPSNISDPKAVPSPAPPSVPAQQVEFGNITLAGETPSAPLIETMPLHRAGFADSATLIDAGALNVGMNNFVNAPATLNYPVDLRNDSPTLINGFGTSTVRLGHHPVIALASTIQTVAIGSSNTYTTSTVIVGNLGANPAASHPMVVFSRRDGLGGFVVADGPVSGAVAAATLSSDATAEEAFLNARENPVSTFGFDVGTASYAIVRRFLDGHQRPPQDAVRIEELLNYFPYDYPPPQGDAPFSATMEVAECPWAPEHRLVRIGVRGREIPGTRVAIARDMKAEVEFNPAQVGAYRLIGYERPALAKKEASRDPKNAGEITAGHAVTTLYELVPAGKELPPLAMLGTLKNQPERPLLREKDVEQPPAGAAAAVSASSGHELLTLKLRYTAPDGGASKLLVYRLSDAGTTWAKSTPDFRFAAAVAGYGMLLRDSNYRGQATWESVAEWAREGLGSDVNGYRAEFLGLVEKAKALAR